MSTFVGMKCEVCKQAEAQFQDGDTLQELCAKCFNEIDTYYCHSCNKLIHTDDVQWLNDCPLCECGAKIEL